MFQGQVIICNKCSAVVKYWLGLSQCPLGAPFVPPPPQSAGTSNMYKPLTHPLSRVLLSLPFWATSLFIINHQISCLFRNTFCQHNSCLQRTKAPSWSVRKYLFLLTLLYQWIAIVFIAITHCDFLAKMSIIICIVIFKWLYKYADRQYNGRSLFGKRIEFVMNRL